LEFVQLDRYFCPIKNDKELDPSVGRYWGPKIGGWVTWNELLLKPRVVLLAEADSGKTLELRETANRLFTEGKAAFFVTVESLVDGTLDEALEFEKLERFNSWQTGFENAYFFLDSVDEARLNQKRFAVALNRLAKAVAGSIERVHLFVTCRVTDWQGQVDRDAISNLFPIKPLPKQPTDLDVDGELLDPIFAKKEQKPEIENSADEDKSSILTFCIVPLQREQQERLAGHAKVNNVSAFITEITKQGLDVFAERPGDLLNLAQYWNEHDSFASMTKMISHSIDRKLAERDPYRADNNEITSNELKSGACRIAATLTLAKSFTLQAPGADQESTPVANTISAARIFTDWSVAKQNALLRRGIFAPSTYGRIRFHHRSTQEYLTARWLESLLHSGCPRHEMFEMLFAVTYGVKTVRPSLRATAAWLAIDNEDIRNEILGCDPLILIQHGDPRSLPLEAKKTLLKNYASLYTNGNIFDDGIDHRELWMFADKRLADTIKEVWHQCEMSEFRDDILRLVFQGEIDDCVDILEAVFFDETSNVYHRILAVEAMVACKLEFQLGKVRKHLLEIADKAALRLTSRLAKALFPKYLSAAELLSVVEKSQPPEQRSIEGFGYDLAHLAELCPLDEKDGLLNSLATLALSKPFKANWRRISQRYGFLEREFEKIAHSQLSKAKLEISEASLIKVLMAIERSDRTDGMTELQPSTESHINSRKELKRQLFWADVDEVLENEEDQKTTTEFWQIYLSRQLWRLETSDLDWLECDLQNKAKTQQKRIALSAVVQLLKQENRFESDVGRITSLVEDCPSLLTAIDQYKRPPNIDKTRQSYQDRHNAYIEKSKITEEKDKNSWRKFRDTVVKTLPDLEEKSALNSFISNITEWLHHRTKLDYPKAVLQWKVLEAAFSASVAEHYCKAMCKFWRETVPERPLRKEGNAVTTKWSTIWAYAAIGIEAQNNSNWAGHLDEQEAEIASKHATVSEQGCPNWLAALEVNFPSIVRPILREQIQLEWNSERPHNDYLYALAHQPQLFSNDTYLIFVEEMLRKNVVTPDKLRRGLEVLQAVQLEQPVKDRLWNFAESGLGNTSTAAESESAIIYVAYLFFLDADKGFKSFSTWLAGLPSQQRAELAFKSISALFERHGHGLIGSSLAGASVDTLKALCNLAYEVVDPRSDEQHEGSFEPSKRDHAEDARSAVLSALIAKSGVAAYSALHDLSEQPVVGDRTHRFKQLARSIAERDSDFSAWTETQCHDFEKQHLLPILVAADLYRAVQSTIADIRFDLENADSSSLLVLKKLNSKEANEDALAQYLIEQLRLRSKSRFHVNKESEVKDDKRPDIVISSTSSAFEVAIEVKQADSWTLPELVEALEVQLAEDYLKPESRRYGILFLADHGRKGWNSLVDNKSIGFDEVLKVLVAGAGLKTSNSCGDICLSVQSISTVG
jgi:hypothetical protein